MEGVRNDGRALEFVADGPFEFGSLVQVYLTPDAKDPAGNSIFDYLLAVVLYRKGAEAVADRLMHLAHPPPWRARVAEGQE